MDDAGDRARRLRREGKTIREIKAELGIGSNDRIAAMLRGEPPVALVRRGGAPKPAARLRARELRASGRSYNAIAAELGVSKSSVSGWCRDIVLTEEQREALMLPMLEAQKKRGATARAGRIRRTELIHDAARTEIGELSRRELFLIGVALYWAEGSKAKPWDPSRGVALINSDPSVIKIFCAWLGLLEVPPEHIHYRLSIHKNADIEAASRFWAEVVGVDVSDLRRPNLKRHNPTTVRRNVGSTYVGCLVVGVRRSTNLNRQIEGWWQGVAISAGRYADLPRSGMV